MCVCDGRSREREREEGRGIMQTEARRGGGTRRSKLQPILRSYDCAKWYAKRFKAGHARTPRTLSIATQLYGSPTVERAGLASSGFLPDTGRQDAIRYNARGGALAPLEISTRSKTRNNGVVPRSKVLIRAETADRPSRYYYLLLLLLLRVSIRSERKITFTKSGSTCYLEFSTLFLRGDFESPRLRWMG